jgi:hypothetical protein
MEVTAPVLKWTAVGMRPKGLGEYIEKREVERLLDEAYRRGFEVGVEKAMERIKSPS